MRYAAAFALWFALVPAALAQGDVKRGQYLAKAAGCVGCHTDTTQGAQPYAGGRALKTPFGTFFGPNITPHPEAGLGKWTEKDFQRALRLGERPDGAHYFPSFPYASFTGMTDADIRDLWAFMRSLPPSDRRNREHDLRFPFNVRSAVAAWKSLYFTPGPLAPNPKLNAAQNRGAYLVNALGHCGECHTPRGQLGGLSKDRLFAGGEVDGKKAPNLTSTRLKKWNDSELKDVLATGNTPDGDMLSATMQEVVTNTLSQLTAEDLSAIVAYLRWLPPQPEDNK
jgi:mono/diheme cytochrome c family protein